MNILGCPKISLGNFNIITILFIIIKLITNLFSMASSKVHNTFLPNIDAFTAA